MILKFIKLNRPAIRKLRPGEKIAEHGIPLRAWLTETCASPSPGWSMERGSIGSSAE